MTAMPNSYQKGVVLIVALIMLVVMTLMGLTSIRIVLQEERMSGNTFDRSLAFQAAEAGLRAGEAAALAQSKLSPPNHNFPGNSGTYTDATTGSCPADYFTDKTKYCNTSGLCKQPDPDCGDRWGNSNFSDVWTNASVTLTSTTDTPQYFIEYLGGNYPCDPSKPANVLSCSRYRVTARSGDVSGRAIVILQSIYATE